VDSSPVILQERFNLKFNDRKLLKMAFTHSSYSKDNYERLEFLGDSILDFVISRYLFFKDLAASEGILTHKRMLLVRNDKLCEISANLNLLQYVIHNSDSIALGDAKKIRGDILEAFIGAIYLDHNIEAVEQFISNYMYADILNYEYNVAKPDRFDTKHGKDLTLLEDKIDFCFSNKHLLQQALVHPSYDSRPQCNYERLEFLGDDILKIFTGLFLYKNYTNSEETLHLRRTALICNANLKEWAKIIDLDKFLIYEDKSPLPESKLANALEAVFGAIFVDQNSIKVCEELFITLLEKSGKWQYTELIKEKNNFS